ncbi:glycosyltransferase [Natrarchaeobaculum sulfurireducens]|uniref:Glycosyltransferase n=1 Tax=Natrarchaeobaculum sulfurireducens TaxID=2044521 RepID=A0A346PGS8_9EURY|nr:glycosyltransferase [Natrarchaeobaculum sulfurireducens]AXR78723.1 Glycosyltransferase [Natrarchaeobaculum sulfurireducens]
MSRSSPARAPPPDESSTNDSEDSSTTSPRRWSDERRNRESSTGSAGTRADEKRVLVITGLAHKNHRHYGPLADVAGKTTLVALEPRYDVDDARYVTVPEIGPRLLRVVLMLFVALYEGYRNEYDAVASISLFPYGWYALVLKAVYGYPAHLGIIGIDLDHHAEQFYGPVPRWAFRRFDVVSVPGTDHARRLAELGVPPDRIERLTNAIDVDTYRPLEDDAADGTEDATGPVDADYDFVWVGRFGPEKDPVRFVEALDALEGTDREFRAVMVGDGQLRSEVEAELAARGLEDRVDLPGWVDEPLSYYRRADAFVLTSERDALPLVMLEAMATGLPAVVPAVGSISDVVDDGENGLLLTDRNPVRFAEALTRCLDDPAFRRRLGENAVVVRSQFSLECAGEDWQRILSTLEG